MPEDFFGGMATEAPPEEEKRGIIERTKAGLQYGWGEEPLGAERLTTPEREGEAPLIPKEYAGKIRSPFWAAADIAYRAAPALGYGAAGLGAGLAERFGMSRAEADRFQRDLGIASIGAMVEPGMGPAAAHAAPEAQAVARAVREAESRPRPPPVVEPEEAAPYQEAFAGRPRPRAPEVPRVPERPPEVPREAPPVERDAITGEPIPPEPQVPRPPPGEDFFAGMEPPKRVTEEIPEEAAPAGERPYEPWEQPGPMTREELRPPKPVAEPVEAEAPPLPKPRKAARARKPESLAQYIARNGGIELTPEARDMGLDKWRPVVGQKAVAREGGKSIDKFWREHLATGEAGYLERDPDGMMQRDIRGELYEMLGNERAKRQKHYPLGEEAAAARKPTEYDQGIEAAAQRIIKEAAEHGLRREELGTRELYAAAERVYRGEEGSPLDIFERTVEEAHAVERGEARGIREALPQVGGERAGPEVQEGIAGAGEVAPGLRAPGEPPPAPRKAVSNEDLAHLNERFIDFSGKGVTPLRSERLDSSLRGLDFSHLHPAQQAIAKLYIQRLREVVGNTPVHYIEPRDMGRFARKPTEIAPMGTWYSDFGPGGRSFIVMNAEHAGDAVTRAHILLHESTHAATIGAVRARPAVRKALRLIMDEAEPHLRNREGRPLYAMTNEGEFLAEAMGNPSVQARLMNVQASVPLRRALGNVETMWDALVEFVRRTLGMPKTSFSLLDATMKVAEPATREVVPVEEHIRTEMARREGPELSPEYRKALGEHNDAQLLYREAVRAFRNGEIDNYAFGRAAEAYKRATAEFDKVFAAEQARGQRREEPGAEGRPQMVLPGAERISDAELAQRRADERMRAKVPQKPMDEGLFGEKAQQADLFAPQPKGLRAEMARQRQTPLPFPVRQAQARARFAENIRRSYSENLEPASVSELALKGDALFAEYKSKTQGEKDRIVREGDQRYMRWNKIPEADQIKFIKAVDTGQPVEPRFRGIAETYRKMLDQAHREEVALGSKAGYVTNYFPHLWERPRTGQAPIDQYVMSLGPKWFQKARTIDFIEQGLAAGYKLRSTNPEALVSMRLLSGADMRMRMELLDTLRRNKMAELVTETNQAADLKREGWFPINAPDGKQWLIHGDLAPLWKNAVEAKGLWDHQGLSGSVFRGWMGFKNVWVPIKLALSAFHPVHVAGINLAHHWGLAASHVLRGGDLATAGEAFGKGLSLYQPKGKMARQQWMLPEEARTPEGKLAVKLLNEGGIVPQMSEQLLIAAKRSLSDAMRKNDPIKTPYHGMRRVIEKIQAPIFEHWIPHLKAAAYLDQAQALLKRRPELWQDELQRKAALRAIGKSIDNRFGEMFYGSLFWNRMIKDAGIGSFLSLGWNLGFVREFGGAAAESIARPASYFRPVSETRATIRDATNKIEFALAYFATSAFMAGVMTYLFTGQQPEGQDFIFPRLPGKNPDGSDRRLSTPFYTREIPMFLKHAQEHGGGVMGTVAGLRDMIWNKMLFQPAVELVKNKDYFGRAIRDEDAPSFQQAYQVMQHYGRQQFMPMSVTGARRAEELGGGTMEKALSFAGFGPAPAYASRTPAQNYIAHLFSETVAPQRRPYEEAEVSEAKRTARMAILRARQAGDKQAEREALVAGKKAGLSDQYMKDIGIVPSDEKMYQRLDPRYQVSVLRRATPEERARYWKRTGKKGQALWNELNPDDQMKQTKFAMGGSVKRTQGSVHYKDDRGTLARHCGNCSMFEKPHGCTAVEGHIEARGKCDIWRR